MVGTNRENKCCVAPYLNFQQQPRAVSETEDQELAALMERVERENAEVSGDEEDEDDSEEGSEEEESDDE